MYVISKKAAELFLSKDSHKIIGKIKFNKKSKFFDFTVFLIKYLLAYDNRNVFYLLLIREDCHDMRVYNNFQEIYGYFNDIASVPSEQYVREE